MFQFILHVTVTITCSLCIVIKMHVYGCARKNLLTDNIYEHKYVTQMIHHYEEVQTVVFLIM